MSDLLTRIQEVISWSALGPAAFADEISVGRPVVSHILAARNKASLEVVQKILIRFPEVSPLWLLSGEGGMLTGLGEVSTSSKEKNEHASPEAKKSDASEIGQQKVEVQKEEIMKKMPERVLPSTNKELVKVVLFYSDGSFESYNPF